MDATFQKGRIFSLDVLRGLAAMLVLFRHAPADLVPASSVAEDVYQFLHRIGWSGVDLFFVLSGFLVGKLLIDELEQTGRIRVARFWIRRSFKIWPSYFAAYGTAFLLQCLRDYYFGSFSLLRERILGVWPNIFFVQNYASCERWPHSWSIAVEEHFYLVLPLILIFLAWRAVAPDGKNMFYRRMFTAMAFIGFVTLMLRLWNDARGADYGINYYQSHLRADALFSGVGLYLLFRTNTMSHRHGRWWLISAVIVLSLTFNLLNRYPLKDYTFAASWGFTLLYVGYGALVYAAACRPDAGRHGPMLVRMVCRTMAWVGVYSYTIYLAHAILFAIPGFESGRKYIILLLSRGEESVSWMLVFADRFIFMALSIIGGVILSRLVERPCLRLRSRCAP